MLRTFPRRVSAVLIGRHLSFSPSPVIFFLSYELPPRPPPSRPVHNRAGCATRGRGRPGRHTGFSIGFGRNPWPHGAGAIVLGTPDPARHVHAMVTCASESCKIHGRLAQLTAHVRPCPATLVASSRHVAVLLDPASVTDHGVGVHATIYRLLHLTRRG
jgi:hypothetical protein